MTGKDFKVPKDIADSLDYLVELHPTFTSPREPVDRELIDRMRPLSWNKTLGTFLRILGRWHDVKVEVQMPIPRDKPWTKVPVVLIYPQDWQLRKSPPADLPKTYPRCHGEGECIGCVDCRTEEQRREGDARPGWQRRSSTSFMFGPQRYVVQLDQETERWRASWWQMEVERDQLWQAQEWVEALERDRLSHQPPKET